MAYYDDTDDVVVKRLREEGVLSWVWKERAANTTEMLRIAAVVAHAGGIEGRMRLQKIVYLLAAAGFDVPADDYHLHLYGPFSEDLANATNALTANGVPSESDVDETPPASGTTTG